MRFFSGNLAKRDEHEERSLSKQNVSPQLHCYPAPLSDSSYFTPAWGEANITPANALGVADAYACVRALSDAAASLPLHVYRRTDAGRERLCGRTAELLERPAPAVTQANLVAQIVAHLNLHGNAYVGKFRNEDGQVEQLACLMPDRVMPELRGGMPFYTVRDDKGRQSVHTTDDIVHIKAVSTDGLVGLSPVRQARVALGLCANLTTHAQRFFANDARPSGILKVPAGMPDEEFKGLRESWELRQRGVHNAHRVAIVSGELEWQPIGMPLDDAQFLEQRKLSATETARIFRVPPWVIGAEGSDSMTYSNVEMQSLHFVTYSLRPWLVVIEQALSADRDLFTSSAYCEFLLDALLRADSATRADIYTKALNPVTGWMTPAEVRRLENLPPDPSFDVPRPASTKGSGNLENVEAPNA